MRKGNISVLMQAAIIIAGIALGALILVLLLGHLDAPSAGPPPSFDNQ